MDQYYKLGDVLGCNEIEHSSLAAVQALDALYKALNGNIEL